MIDDGELWDWYAILRVREDATEDEIKAAYRYQAKKWHTDTNSSPEARERMQLINRAHEVLSDTRKRAEYNERLRRAEEPPVIGVRPSVLDFGILRPGGGGVNPERGVELFDLAGSGMLYEVDVPKALPPWKVELVGVKRDGVVNEPVVRFELTRDISAGTYSTTIVFAFCDPETKEVFSAAEVAVTARVEAPVRRPTPAPRAPAAPTTTSLGLSKPPAGSWRSALLCVLAGLGLVALPFGVMAVAVPISHINDPNPPVLSILAMLVIGPSCFVGLLAAVFCGLPMCLAAAYECAPVHGRR